MLVLLASVAFKTNDVLDPCAAPCGLKTCGDFADLPCSTLSDGFTLGLGVLWCDHRWVNVTGGQCHKDTVYDGAKPRTRAGKGRGRGRGRR